MDGAGSGQVARLVDRHPSVSPERLIGQLRPPPTFAEVSFATYRPDPAEPTQAAAVESCREFCRQAVQRRAGRRKLLGRREPLPGVGLYLDGGFGVGKTHLLASAYYQLPEGQPKAFATFGELTQLAGVFGFAECIELLSDYTAVCIDEFELDDPGNTTLVSRLLSSLVQRGVSVAATSNTLPEQLGEGRFAAQDFFAKSIRWQAFSLPLGSRVPTIGIAIYRRLRRRCPTTRFWYGPPPCPGLRSMISTSCARTWPPCTRRGT